MSDAIVPKKRVHKPGDAGYALLPEGEQWKSDEPASLRNIAEAMAAFGQSMEEANRAFLLFGEATLKRRFVRDESEDSND